VLPRSPISTITRTKSSEVLWQIFDIISGVDIELNLNYILILTEEFEVYLSCLRWGKAETPLFVTSKIFSTETYIGLKCSRVFLRVR